MSWHQKYRGRTIGRVLHFLYYYCGFDVAELAKIGSSEVILYGEIIATFEWLSDTDIPFFTFLPVQASSDFHLREIRTENQKQKMVEAIKAAEDQKKEDCQECKKIKWQIDFWKDSSEQAWKQIHALKAK